MVKLMREEARRLRLLQEYHSAVLIKRYLRMHVARAKYRALLARRDVASRVVIRFFQVRCRGDVVIRDFPSHSPLFVRQHLYPRMQLYHTRPIRQLRNRGMTLLQARHRGYLARKEYDKVKRAARMVSRATKGYARLREVWWARANLTPKPLQDSGARHDSALETCECMHAACCAWTYWTASRASQACCAHTCCHGGAAHVAGLGRA